MTFPDLSRRGLDRILTALQSRVAVLEGQTLDARIAALEAVTGRVAGYFTGSTTAVGTTATIIATGDIVIPADWNTYDIVCHWGARFIDSTGGNTGISTAVSAYVDLDGTTISSTQATEVTDLNTSDVSAVSGPGFAAGETTTGTRTLDLVAVRGGAPTVNALGIRLVVEAWRTS